MGSSYEFACTTCSYTFQGSGGPDEGRLHFTETVVCLHCRELADITVGLRDDPQIFAFRCDQDPAHRVQSWHSGEPCPQCGARLDRGAPIALWG